MPQPSSQSHAEMLHDIFGPIEHQYTQAEAIADGLLVPVTTIAQRHGLKIKTLMTRALLFSLLSDSDAEEFKDGEFHMAIAGLFSAVIQAVRSEPNVSIFSSACQNYDDETVEFLAQIATDDDGKPCVLLSLPGED